MNLYLLNLVGKWIGILFVTGVSFFGGYKEKEVTVTNSNKNMSLNLTTELIAHQTETKYNNQKPSGETTVVVQGIDGYLVRNNGNNETKIIKEATTEIIEVGTYVPPVVKEMEGNSFIGRLTVYHCAYQSVCKTSSGYNLKSSVYYEDATFGKVRVLSAAQSKFKVGTIIEVSSAGLETFYGIVLDWGGDMVSAWRNGKVWIDLAVDPNVEPAMASFSSNNINFNVKRWGY